MSGDKVYCPMVARYRAETMSERPKSPKHMLIKEKKYDLKTLSENAKAVIDYDNKEIDMMNKYSPPNTIKWHSLILNREFKLKRNDGKLSLFPTTRTVNGVALNTSHLPKIIGNIVSRLDISYDFNLSTLVEKEVDTFGTPLFDNSIVYLANYTLQSGHKVYFIVSDSYWEKAYVEGTTLNANSECRMDNQFANIFVYQLGGVFFWDQSRTDSQNISFDPPSIIGKKSIYYENYALCTDRLVFQEGCCE